MGKRAEGVSYSKGAGGRCVTNPSSPIENLITKRNYIITLYFSVSGQKEESKESEVCQHCRRNKKQRGGAGMENAGAER